MRNDFESNYADIRERTARAALRRGEDPAKIHIVAVSKTVGIDAVAEAYDCGVRDFGENRVRELLSKQEALPAARWHLIGHLQTNKVKDVIGKAWLIHSLDRWDLAEYIEKKAAAEEISVPMLLQVNVSGEASKGGLSPADVEPFLKSIGQMRWVKVMGLMTMAPEEDDPEKTRPVFKELRSLFDVINGHNYPNVQMRFLSMGMTQDFEIAIEEGANIIRVGRALFGPRL